MKTTFETEDEKEVLLLLNAGKMASFIWQLKHNTWRQFKHEDYDYEKAWDAINEELDKYGINIDELID